MKPRTTLSHFGTHGENQSRPGDAVQLPRTLEHTHALLIAVGANPRHAHRHRRHRWAETPILFVAFRGRLRGGRKLGALAEDANVEAVITTTRRTQHDGACDRALRGGNQESYRVLFDVRPADDSNGAIDLRMYLRIGGQAAFGNVDLSRWTPPPVKDRKAAL